jgi:hypothetical protein
MMVQDCFWIRIGMAMGKSCQQLSQKCAIFTGNGQGEKSEV